MSENENECEGNENEIEDDDSGAMPWASFNPLFTFVKEAGPKNFVAKCKSCGEEKGCAFSSTNNLKQHLKRKHSYSDAQLKALNTSTTAAAPSERSKSSTSENVLTLMKRNAVKQEHVDAATDKLILLESLPHRICDSPFFKAAILLGLPGHLTVSCRQTFKKRLKQHYEEMKQNLSKTLAEVEFVSTTADGWSRLRRSFLGMGITWLDPKTIDRRFAVLALRRLKGRHTNERLAKEMHSVHEEYGVTDKVTRTTTDSASNFRKAFRVLGPVENPNGAAAPAIDNESNVDDDLEGQEDEDEDGVPEDEDEDVPVVLDDILSEMDLDGVVLPPQQRCAAHLVNLIATKDSREALETNAAYRRLEESALPKLRQWWRRQNRSDLVANVIQEGLGVKFIVPGDTRWNSTYDAIKQIVKLLDSEEAKLTNILESAGLQKLTVAEKVFLREWVHVMEPVATALDILQRDKEMYLGYLLPTVLCMERNLIARRQKDGRDLKYCDVLCRTLIRAVRSPRRFGEFLDDRTLNIAACIIPTFKLDWVPDDKKPALKEAILEEMKMVKIPGQDDSNPGMEMETERFDDQQDQDQQIDLDDPPQPQTGAHANPDEESFFGFLPCLAVAPPQETQETAEEELERFLAKVTRAHTVKQCYAEGANGKREYPRLAQVFLKYNTALPSSGSIERSFSGVRYVFGDLRNRLNDETLEMEVCLKQNASFWAQV